MRRLRRRIVPFALIVGAVVAPACLVSAGGAGAAAWLPVQGVPTIPSDIAVDADGDAVVVGRGGGGAVQATTRPFGGSWTPAATLTAAGDTLPSRPKVTVDGSGNAVAVWSALNGGDPLIRVASRPAGGTWSAAAELSDDETLWSENFALATDRQGRTTVVWTEQEGSNYLLRTVSRPAAGSWSGAAATATTLTTSSDDVRSPSVAVGGNAAVTVAWIGIENAPGGSGVVTVVRSRSRDTSWGAWSPTHKLSTGELEGVPHVVVDRDGDSTAVWGQDDGGFAVRTAHRPAGGSWGAAGSIGAGTEHQLAVAPNGTLTAVWVAPNGGGSAIRTRTSTDGGTSWMAPADLTTAATPNALQYPQVAADDQGDVTAIWGRFSGSQATAETARRAAGTWSAEADLSVGQLSGLPVGAVDPKGHVTLAWTEPSALPGASSIFDPVAPELRDVSLPPAPRAGERFTVSVVPFDVSAVDVRWDFGDGTSASGPAATHVYATEGPRTITVTATDAAGNVTEKRWMLAVIADPAPTPDPKPDPKPDPTPDPKPSPVAPVLTGLKQNVSRWNTRRVRGSILPVGTEFTFMLDRPAQVRLRFDQVLDGRRAGKRCATPTRKNRKKATCKRFEKRGSIVVTGKARGNFVSFRGKVGGKTLRAGRYRVQVTATADGTTSKAATATFTIAR